MTELAHTFRMPFGRERHFRLERDALCWTHGSTEGRVTYDDISRVWLWRHQLAGHRCDLRHKQGKIFLLSYQFPRLIKREDRSASYTPLVRELIARVASANPCAEFRAGQPWWMREALGTWSQLIIGVLIGLPVLLMISIADRWPAAQTYLLVFLNFVVVLALWRYIRHNAPRPFNPHGTWSGELPE